jgi:outer membrane protein assembly factor BamB
MRGPLSLALLALTAAAVRADDWPQWMGPTRDAVWHETGIVEKFPQGGPKKLWSVPVAGGYAGPAVAAGKVYVADRIDAKDAAKPKSPFDAETGVAGTERVLCFDAKNGGAPLWTHKYPVVYQVSYGAGPRCTPTVSEGKVYTLGAMGNLFCFDAEKGSVLWEKDFRTDYKAKSPTWGFCGHPLVYGNLLVCLVGGADALVVAFDKDTGKEVWKALKPKSAGGAGYAPPTVVKVGGADQIVQFHPTGITGLDPKTGAEKWTVPLRQPEYGMSIMAPRPSGPWLFAGGEEAAVGMKLADEGKYEAVWTADAKAKGVFPVNMTPFVEGDTIYGVDKSGMLRAVDLKTGERRWYAFEPVIGKAEQETYKAAPNATAFIVKNGDRFFLFNEKGDLVIAKLTPAKYTEIDSTHLIEPTGASWGRKVVWTHPAFADKCVFVRNDKELVCYSLAK